jgi:hypothetical protein
VVDEARERPLALERQRVRRGHEGGVLLGHADLLAEAVGAPAAQADVGRDPLAVAGAGGEALERVRFDDERQVGDAVPQGFGHVHPDNDDSPGSSLASSPERRGGRRRWPGVRRSAA